MFVRLLGGFSVVEGVAVVERFPTQRAKDLLAYLTCYRQRHAREVLAEMLWPGGNPDAIRLRLNQTVSEIRRALREFGDPILSDRFSLQLHPEVGSDVDLFSRALASAGTGDGREAALRAACEGVSGELLPGFLSDWVGLARDEFDERLKGALAEVVELAMARGDWGSALDPVGRLAAMDPYSETFHLKLLQCLEGLGDRSKALALHERFEDRLMEEFAIGPSAAVQAFVARLRGGAGASVRSARPVLSGGATSSGSIDEVFRIYLEWDDAERAMRLASALLAYWNLRGELGAAWVLLKRIFALPSAASAAADARCAALITFGFTATSVGEARASDAATGRALEIARGLRHLKFEGDALRALGQSELRQGRMGASRLRFEESLKVCEELNDLGGAADSLTGIGETLRFEGRFAEAEVAHRKAFAFRERLGRMDRTAHSRLNLGIIASRMGRYEAALSLIREALAVLRERGSRVVVADCLMEIAGGLAFTGHPDAAVRLLAAVSSLRRSISAPLPLPDRPDYARFMAKAREGLSKGELAREWALGEAAPLGETIDLALLIDLL